MHLRLYNKQTDFTYIAQWIRDDKTHALWCANLLLYPLFKEELGNYLVEQNLKFCSQFECQVSQNVKDHDGAYVYADENDHPVGFFIYTVNKQDKSGFVRFIMVDNTVRGKGYGTAMLRELQQFAYEKTGVSSLRLIVFDVNTAARTCYEKAGFTVIENLPDTFSYRDETWRRRMMEHRADFERNY